jgi:hypothetical protein
MLAFANLLSLRTIPVMLVASFYTPRLSLLPESLHRFRVAVKACSADATAGSTASVASSKCVLQASSSSEKSPAELPRSELCFHRRLKVLAQGVYECCSCILQGSDSLPPTPSPFQFPRTIFRLTCWKKLNVEPQLTVP